jgi:hypothetical protein
VTGSRRLVMAVVLAALAAAGAIVLRPPAATAPSLAYFLVNDDPAVVDRRVWMEWDLTERLIRDCMAAAGLSYVALHLPTTNDADAALSPRDRVAKDGFGATTRLDPPEIAETDPNMSYLEGLAPARQDAYRAALLGDDTPADPGCQQIGQKAVLGPRATAIGAIEDLVDELAAAKTRDPLVQRGEAAWRACARAAGLPVSRQDAQAMGHDLFAARLAQVDGASGGEAADRLAALQDEERRVALAIHACDEAFAHDTQPPAAAVERDWATRHHDRLGPLRARLLAMDEELEHRWNAIQRRPTPPYRPA